MAAWYVSPTCQRQSIGDVLELRDKLLCLTDPYWKDGNGGASLECRRTDGTNVKLLVLPNAEFGTYLKYIEYKSDRADKTWLSLGDPTKLGVVTECSDEWYASIGLFIPPEASVMAIEDFIRDGSCSTRITWIRPADLPREGNW